MPFDRLIGWVDDWAVANARSDLAAQIGPSDFAPKALEVIPFMDPQEFRCRMLDATAVVAHAGMGTIITALELGKPILVVPRLGDLDETRNDHQIATAKHLAEDNLILAAYNEEEFAKQMLLLEHQPERAKIASQGSDKLLARLRDFTLDEPWPPGT